MTDGFECPYVGNKPSLVIFVVRYVPSGDSLTLTVRIAYSLSRLSKLPSCFGFTEYWERVSCSPNLRSSLWFEADDFSRIILVPNRATINRKPTTFVVGGRAVHHETLMHVAATLYFYGNVR